MIRHPVLAFAYLLVTLSFPLAGLVTLLLLERKLVLGRIPVLLVEELGGDVLPELSTFLGELLLDGTHNLGNNL